MAGIKLWKPIGLGFQAKDGSYLRPDDPRLGCIFETAAQMHIPVLFHIADPVAFFSPADAYNERYEELCQHPDWSFCDSKFYRFHQLMEMQENLIAAHPNTTFVIAHVGSYAENLSQVAAWLDRFPRELSGGELQRFCVARALLSGADYLICDEISTMLDVITQAQIWRVILDQAAARHMGILAVTHNRNLAERIAGRVIDLVR